MYKSNLLDAKQGLELLQGQVDFERNLKESHLADTTKISIDSVDSHTRTNRIKLHVAGVDIVSLVDRPFIHKFGQQLWNDLDSYEKIEDRWKKAIRNSAFLSELLTAIKESGLKVRYFTDGRLNRAYGYMGENFVDVDQIAFRNDFLEKFKEFEAFDQKDTKFQITKHGDLIEFFNINSPGYQTEFRYGIKHAKNNGYDAYKTIWQRLVLICTNGLTDFRTENTLKWNHNQAANLEEFISTSLESGIGNQQFLEEQIALRMDSPLEKELTEELVERLSLANSTKDRLRDRLRIEIQHTGRNEWSMSQAMTHLGTHDRHISIRTKSQMTTVGTLILEQSIHGALSNGARLQNDGYYGLVLPNSFAA